MKKAQIGYQLYSAREDAAKDLAGVLGQVAALGYDGVEFAGYYGHSAAQIVQMLKEVGLKAVSSHVSIPETVAGMYEAIAYLAQVGCKYAAVPYLDEMHRPGSAGFAATIAQIYRFGSLCKQAGIQLLYHNHDFEFITLSGQYGLDFLYDAVPADLLQTEIDCCWVKYAGEDPAAYVRKYAGRAPVVHLKDYVGRKGGGQPYALLAGDNSGKDDGTAAEGGEVAFEFRPVGHGCQDVPALVEAGLDAGAKWFIVEQDLSVGRTPLEAAAMSIRYLRSIGL